ncbi:hypothetical protein EON65_19345, partial [archaeon]
EYGEGGAGRRIRVIQSAMSIVPTRMPTVTPTATPTQLPSVLPTAVPTVAPTVFPTVVPTVIPTVIPTKVPTVIPTAVPTRWPTGQPTGHPTGQPTSQPSMQPSGHPSKQPVGQPTSQPSSQPSRQPTVHPSVQPTGQPTGQPTRQPSYQPSMQPSSQPSMQPSGQPTLQPSTQPSSQPSSQPSGQPSSQPSRQPSGQPSCQPSGQPSAQPNSRPSGQPSDQPTFQLSWQPSVQPSGQPSSQPSNQPSTQLSSQPSSQPTSRPSACPSAQPSSQPSRQPSGQPTVQPSGQPSSQPFSRPTRPTCQPSAQPSGQPSSQPTVQPSGQPSIQPSSQPSGQPTTQPSGQPSSQPSMQPTEQPTGQPSRQPSSQPSSQLSAQPTSQPSGHPTSQSTGQPSVQPSSQPSMQPSGQQSCQPSGQPSAKPSSQLSMQPTSQSFRHATTQPSTQPSRQPTAQSLRPKNQPSGKPSMQPSCQPSLLPSILPVWPSPPAPSTIPPSCAPTAIATFFAVFPARQPGSGVNSNISSNAGNDTTGPTLNTSLAIGVLSGLSSGQAEIVVVTEEVRVVSQVLSLSSPNSSIIVALPLTEQEAILQVAGKLVLPSISLVVSNSSGNNSTAYVAVAVLSATLWIPTARSSNSSFIPGGGKNESSPTLADKVGQLQSDVITVVTVGSGIDFVDIGFPAASTAKVNATPSINFTIYCQPRIVMQKTFYCNDTGYVEIVQCNGLTSVFRGTCPKLQQTCAALDLASMTVARGNLCQTIKQNYTSQEKNGTSGSRSDGLLCRCSMGEGLNVPGSSMVAAGVVLGLVSSDLSKTLQASSAFEDGSAASKAAIVLSIFVSVWILALFATLYLYGWNTESKSKDISNKQELHGMDKIQNALLDVHPVTLRISLEKNIHQHEHPLIKLAGAYLMLLFPPVFFSCSLLEGLCCEVYRKHMYINFFLRLRHSHNPIIDIVKVVTLQSFLLFLLALLYDLNMPSDDGSCVLLTSKVACLQRRLFFDPSQAYCQWKAFQYADLLATDDDAVYFECTYGDPSVSLTAATYTSMILSLATCLVMGPLEYILSLLAAATVDDVNQAIDQQLAHSDGLCKRLCLTSTDLAQDGIHPSVGIYTYKKATVQAVTTASSQSLFRNFGRGMFNRTRIASKVSRILPSQLPSMSAEASFTLVQETKCYLQSRFHDSYAQSDALLPTQHRGFDMIALEKAIHMQRARLLLNNENESANLLGEFDRGWCLDNSTGLFLEVNSDISKAHSGLLAKTKIAPTPLIPMGSFTNDKIASIMVNRHSAPGDVINMRDVILQDLVKVQQKASATMEELEEQTQAERGFEVLVLFVQDILGRSTAAAHIFGMKMEMDYETIPKVSKWAKMTIVLLLLCLNTLFFYITLLRGISKGLAWQRSYLIAWLLQSVVDICVFETMQVAWFHYIIPSLVKKEVNKAKTVLEETAVKAVINFKQPKQCNEISELNAPDFLFISNQLARMHPQLVESYLVQQYRSSLPGNAGLSWLGLVDNHTKLVVSRLDHNRCGHLSDVESNGQPENKKHNEITPLTSCNFWKICFYSSHLVITVILQLVVSTPLVFQRLFIRVIEPVLLSGVLFFFLLISSRPIFLALTIVSLVALAVIVVWEHVCMIRERRRVASSSSSVPEPIHHLRDEKLVLAEAGRVDNMQSQKDLLNCKNNVEAPNVTKDIIDAHSQSSHSTVNSKYIRDLFSDMQSSGDEKDDKEDEPEDHGYTECSSDAQEITAEHQANDTEHTCLATLYSRLERLEDMFRQRAAGQDVVNGDDECLSNGTGYGFLYGERDGYVYDNEYVYESDYYYGDGDEHVDVYCDDGYNCNPCSQNDEIEDDGDGLYGVDNMDEYGQG